MKIGLVTGLFFSLVSFCLPQSTRADSGYTAREILRSNFVFLQVANRNGWLVTEVYEKDGIKTILLGPDGYKRDLSPFMSSTENNKSFFAKSVSDDGTVYFETTSYTNEGGVIDSRIFSLARNSDETQFITGVTRRETLLSTSSVNESGDVFISDSNKEGSNNTIEIRALGNGMSLQRTLSFPNRITTGSSYVSHLFDNQRRYIITREQLVKYKRKVIDVCVGDLRNEEVVCATPEQVSKITFRGKGYIAAFSDGKFLVSSGGKVNLIEGSTLQVIKSFRYAGFNLPSVHHEGQDLSVVSLYSVSSKSGESTKLSVTDPFLGAQKLSCGFISKFASSMLPFSQIVKPTSTHFYLVLEGSSETSENYTKILYELSLSDSNYQASPVVGVCRSR